METSVVTSNEMDANQPANHESGEGHNQPEETGIERLVSIREGFQGRLIHLMDVYVPVKEKDGQKPLIGQLPLLLREKTELKTYFKPRIVSIGPVHHDERELVQGQQYKLQLAKLFIEKNGLCYEALCNNILKEIESFKTCYDQELLEKFHGNDEDLAWMFFVDGCALIQLVRCLFENEFIDIAADQKDTILIRDLLLLENQLPLGVLNLVMVFGEQGGELYQNNHSVGKQSKEFRQSICLLIELIAKINFQIWENGLKADSVNFDEANHLLELIWMNLVKKEAHTTVPISPTVPSFTDRLANAATSQFHAVKDLQAEGIILEPNNSSTSLRNISFVQEGYFCKLKIPRFRVSGQGKFLLFNLIAFEMHPNLGKDRVVTSYISFLNSIIATKEDVAELRKAGILLTYRLTDEEILKTFEELNSSLTRFPDIFSSTRMELIGYFKDKKRGKMGKWIKELKEVYFREPSSTINFILAIYGLTFTIIQTVFSILTYQHK